MKQAFNFPKTNLTILSIGEDFINREAMMSGHTLCGAAPLSRFPNVPRWSGCVVEIHAIIHAGI
ncbi:MAG: hypothetical protein P8P54_11135 [Pseudomonadales bacterium]|nr:hypothetical protein [Pseudomonadales bacterium]